MKGFSLGGVAYQLSPDGLSLVKAGKIKQAPGQMDLFGGAPAAPQHRVGDKKTENGVTYTFNRNNRWERVESGGAAPGTVAGMQVIEDEPGDVGGSKANLEVHAALGKKIVARARSVSYYGRVTPEDAEYKGLDAEHPGIEWDEDLYDEALDAYRSGGASALGKKFLKDARDDENIGSMFTRFAIDATDWPAVQRHAQQHLMGAVKPFKGDEISSKLAEYFELSIDNLKEDGDDTSEIQSALQAPESTLAFFRKDSKEDYQWLDSLADTVVSAADADTIGKTIAKSMKLDRAIAREQKTGHGIRKIPEEKSSSARVEKVAAHLKESANWGAIASVLKGENRGLDEDSQLVVDLLRLSEGTKEGRDYLQHLSSSEKDSRHILKMWLQALYQKDSWTNTSSEVAGDVRARMLTHSSKLNKAAIFLQPKR